MDGTIELVRYDISHVEILRTLIVTCDYSWFRYHNTHKVKNQLFETDIQLNIWILRKKVEIKFWKIGPFSFHPEIRIGIWLPQPNIPLVYIWGCLIEYRLHLTWQQGRSHGFCAPTSGCWAIFFSMERDSGPTCG